MSDYLLDTDVVIDILRGHIGAEEWFAGLPERPAIACFALLEVLQGCKNKAEQRGVEWLMSRLPILYPSIEDIERAIHLYSPYCLSHGVGAMDLLIASLATGHNLTLVTLNVKHFKAIPNLHTIQPYQR